MTKLYKRENGVLYVKNPNTSKYVKAEYTRKDGRVVKSSTYYKLLRQNDIISYEQHKKERKQNKKEYNIKMDIEVKVGKDDKVQPRTATFNNIKISEKKKNDKTFITKLANKWIDTQNAKHGLESPDMELKRVKFNTVRMLENKQINLKDVPMKGQPIQYNSLGVNTNIKKGLCVIDFIYRELKDKKYFKTLTYEKLKIDFPFYKNGITTSEIINWAKDKKYISVYAVDPFMKLFDSYIADDAFYSLVFLCNNNHCYPITDEEQRQQIFKSKSINIKKLEYHIEDTESYIYVDNVKDSYDKLVNGHYNQKLILIDCDKNDITMYELVNDIIKHSNTMIETIHFDSDKRVSAFMYRKKVYVNAPDYEKRKDIVDKLHKQLEINELKFNNHSYAQISKNILQYFLHKNPEKSEYNPQVAEIIEKYKPKPFVVKYKNERSGDAFDIKKSYSAFLINNTYEYPIFTVCDEVKPYEKDDITPGLYYVDRVIYLTVDNKIFLDRGYYTHMTIDKALKRGAITKDDIKFVIKAGHHHKSDYFKGLVEFTFNNFEEKEAKKIVNSFTGSLGTRYSNTTYGCITDDYDTAMGCVKSEADNNRECKTVILNDYYFVRSVKKTRLDSDLVPFYMLILEGGLWNLVELHDNIYEPGVSEVIYCNTDCIGIMKPKKSVDDACRDDALFNQAISPALPFYNQYDIGGFRHEIWKPRGKSPLFNLNDEYYYEEPLWNEYNEPEDYKQYLQDLKEMKSFFIQGDGGSGKSYTVVQLMKEMPDKKFIFLSFTNKVVIELKKKGAVVAYTLDKFFHKDTKRNLTDIYGLIIDEFSMIPMKHLSKLMKLKKLYSHLEFMILGDQKQVPAVITDGAKCYKYTSSYVMKYLCKFNYIQSRYKAEYSRYDQNTYNILTEFVDKQQLSEKLKDKTLKPGLMQNLCYYRKTAEKVNDKCKKLFIKNNPNAQKITEDFYVGMKVISNENNPILDIYNSETFTIVDYERPYISIKSDLTQEITKVNIINFKKMFDLAYCITIHRSQGSTLEGEYNIYDIEALTFELMYVALSRCRNINNVYFDYIAPFIFWKQEYTDDSILRNGLYKEKTGEKYDKGKIYKVLYKNEEIYIGQTCCDDLQTRLKQHIKDADKLNDKFHEFIQSLDNTKLLTIELIKLCPCRSHDELLAEEERQIQAHKRKWNLLNTVHNKPSKIKQERKVVDKERFIKDYIKLKEEKDRFNLKHNIPEIEKKSYIFRYGKDKEAARKKMEAKKNELIEILFSL